MVSSRTAILSESFNSSMSFGELFFLSALSARLQILKTDPVNSFSTKARLNSVTTYPRSVVACFAAANLVVYVPDVCLLVHANNFVICLNDRKFFEILELDLVVAVGSAFKLEIVFGGTLKILLINPLDLVLSYLRSDPNVSVSFHSICSTKPIER